MADVENSDYINAVFVHVSIPRIFYAAGTGDKERSAFFVRKTAYSCRLSTNRITRTADYFVWIYLLSFCVIWSYVSLVTIIYRRLQLFEVASNTKQL